MDWIGNLGRESEALRWLSVKTQQGLNLRKTDATIAHDEKSIGLHRFCHEVEGCETNTLSPACQLEDEGRQGAQRAVGEFDDDVGEAEEAAGGEGLEGAAHFGGEAIVFGEFGG